MSWVDLLPEPRTRRFRRSVEWARTRATKYPFAARTEGTFLKPHVVEERMNDYFLRVPFPASGFTIWAFSTEEARHRFLKKFKGRKYEND